MSCPFLPNDTVTGSNGSIQWWQVSGTLAQNLSCEDTYLRPDVGGALQPWPFTLLQIIIHLPVIAVRVAKWEDVQTLSVVLAAFNVFLVSLAYASTQLTAEHVLVWSPITLVLDAGAMLQLVILVRTEHPDWWQEFVDSFRSTKKKGDSVELGVMSGGSSSDSASTTGANPNQATASGGLQDPPPLRRVATAHLVRSNSGPKRQPANRRTKQKKREEGKPVFVVFILIGSFFLFLAIFGLQITGLVFAFRSYNERSIEASWCSPMFALFGVAELDLNCIFRPVNGDPHKGIGCIKVPGQRQHFWVVVTIICLILSIVIEAFDFLLLTRADPEDSWPFHWAKLKRPWFTMVVGLIVLFFILEVGTSNAYALPDGVSSKMWLVNNATQPFLCNGGLYPAGLRGQFLGWLDGLFHSWGKTYFGF